MRLLSYHVGLFFILFSTSSFAAECQPSSLKAEFEKIQNEANSGNATAQYDLGRMFEYGICTEPDDTSAIKQYKLSAAQGNSDAAYRLGVLHDNGWGTKEDNTVASSYYRKAAQKNHTLAQHDLAIMYMQGTGVVKDNKLAYKWLYIADQRGDEKMKKHLKRVEALLTEDEIAEAQSLAINWLSSN